MDSYQDSKKLTINLTERFENDTMFASHFMDMLEGKNPLVSLIEKYGDDLRSALEDPEMAEELAGANEKYVERLGKEKRTVTSIRSKYSQVARGSRCSSSQWRIYR